MIARDLKQIEKWGNISYEEDFLMYDFRVSVDRL